MLSLDATTRFSVWSLARRQEIVGGDQDFCGDLNEEATGDTGDVPLGDSALQVLLETLNLAPRTTTEKVRKSVSSPIINLPWLQISSLVPLVSQ